jgi:hypothetical protein
MTRRRVHHADDMMARITADRLVAHLEASGFLVMRKPPAGRADSVKDAEVKCMNMDTTDQVIDTEAAQSLSADVGRDHRLGAWIVVRDQPQPGVFTARLVTTTPTPYVVVSTTLEELRAQLPAGLRRSERQPADPSDLVEISGS